MAIRVLVTGATGAVGPSVVAALVSRGICVRAFARKPLRAGILSARVEFVAGDIQNLAQIESATEGVDAIVHLAARLHVPAATDTDESAAYAVNVRGTENLLAAARNWGVSRLVFASTIAVYGTTRGQPATEESEARPVTPYASTKLRCEKAVLAARNGQGAPLGVVLRLGAVYGPHVKGNYEALMRALELRHFVAVGAGNNVRSLIYELDVAKAVLLALEHPSAPGHTYNVTDGTVHTVDEIVSAICHALGRRPPRFRLPAAPCMMMARASDGIRALLTGSPSGLAAALTTYLTNIAVRADRIQTELGFVADYDLLNGWRDTIGQRLLCESTRT
jgi:nucleoside-diphosphate-sugar epimerase